MAQESRDGSYGRLDQNRRDFLRRLEPAAGMRTSIRLAIVAELRRRHMTTNELAALVAGHVHRSHVYDFIAGRKELSTEKASHLLNALRLRITARETPKGTELES